MNHFYFSTFELEAYVNIFQCIFALTLVELFLTE